ncbi:RluA family pseudouridine synthase [Desulfurivibrio alkaliphilus]|nr:RluA family pseudouridine synthase [Desulfurivibrio alkaliphilus]
MVEPSSFAFVVAPHEAGRRLDQVLAMRVVKPLGFTRSRLQALIRQGQVTVASAAGTATGAPVKPGTLLKAGDRIDLRVPPPEPVDLVAEHVDFSLLYEDDDILVLTKPPGLVVHPADGHRQGTLVHGLLYHCRTLSGISGQLRPGIVHRLDKDTSGCLVVAKNDQAHHSLVRQFKGQQVEKKYQALLRGILVEDAGRVELPIGRHPVNRKKMAVRREEGREALTHWRVRQRFSVGYTLVDVRLETGRTHQIRVHMAAMGHPLAGDRLYGRNVEADRQYGIERQWLHAWQLAFNHPRSGHRLSFTAPLWPDLQASLARLQELAKIEK